MPSTKEKPRPAPAGPKARAASNGHARTPARPATPGHLADPSAAAEPETDYRLIPLNAIQLSPHNPRKTLDDAALQELAASIQAKGVLEPILLRPAAQERNGKRYELIAGERRLRAANMAGLTVIPARIHPWTDREAREIQVIENEQRADVPALEKAAGYRDLVDHHGYTVEELAKKIGKSPGTIYGTLKLLQLPAPALKAFEAGELPAATATLIARIPNEQLRKKAAEEIAPPPGAYDNEPLSFRRAKEVIAREYMVELKSAPFNRDDESLLPRAGSCRYCPKMTGNNREEYPDGRADVCTDPGCYREKVQLHQERLIAQAREAGRTVLSEAESKKLFPYGSHLSGDKYVDLKETLHLGGKEKSWKHYVGEALAGETVLALDGKGELHQLVPRARALEVLERDHQVKQKAAERTTRYTDAWKKQEAKRIAEQKGKRAAEAILIDAARLRAERLMGTAVGFTADALAVLRAVAGEVLASCWHEARARVYKAHAFTPGKTGEIRDDAHALAATLDAAGCLGLLAEVAAYHACQGWYPGDGRKADALPFFAAMQLHPDAVHSRVKNEAKVKAEKKGGKRGANPT